MGSTKWLIGLMMLFAIATIFSNIIEETYFTQSNVMTMYDAFNSFSAISFANPVTFIWGILVSLGNIIMAIWNALIWNYSFLQGDWQLVRWLICLPISIGIGVGFLYETAQTFKI